MLCSLFCSDRLGGSGAIPAMVDNKTVLVDKRQVRFVMLALLRVQPSGAFCCPAAGHACRGGQQGGTGGQAAGATRCTGNLTVAASAWSQGPLVKRAAARFGAGVDRGGRRKGARAQRHVH